MFTNRNSDELNGLLQDFYRLTGMKICIYDEDGRETHFYPDRFTPFCKKLREETRYDELCRKCDETAIADCRRTGRAKIYICHAGLTECIAPILLNGVIRGFIAVGQIREKTACDVLGEEHPLAPLYREMPVVGREKTEAALHILEACAAYDKLKEYVRETSRGFSATLQGFIDANLTGDLTVDALMKACRISRVDLYKLTEAAFGCTPAELVKLRRLHCAEQLLKTTDKSIQKIAIECGIGDYNYFSKIFKKRYSLSPREYRKNTTTR